MRYFLLFSLLLVTQFMSAQSDFYIKFPDDVLANCGSDVFPGPELYNPNGLLITMDYTDQMITIVPDACYKIVRDWTVKGPNYDPNLPCIQVANPNPNAIANHPDNLPGPIVSPAGTAAPWSPTITLLGPADPLPVDFSIYWSSTANCYHYTQTIKIVDTDRPLLYECPVSLPVFHDSTTNHPQFWNAAYSNDPLEPSRNLGEGATTLSMGTFDYCAFFNSHIQYLLFLDLDQDGNMETVINSDNPPPAGQVNFDNVKTPGFQGGSPIDFDLRNVPAGQKYRFGLKREVYVPPGSSNPYGFGTVAWNTLQNQSSWATPQLPEGQHKIKWIISDNCGNESGCEYPFSVVCHNSNESGILWGKILSDTDLDCQATPGDTARRHWIIQAEQIGTGGIPTDTLYSSISPDDRYYFFVDTGQYRLSALLPNDYSGICQNAITTPLSVEGDTAEVNFIAFHQAECPFLETDLSTPILRRCFNNTYTVRYCNTGTTAAEDAFIRVKLDPFLTYVSASRPAVFEGNHTWRFDIGHIATDACDQFSFIAHLECEGTQIGQTHCVEAHIYPDSFCLETPLWSGANVEVAGSCYPDSVRFTLHNTGQAATSLLEYIVIEDNIITRQAPFQLPAGDSMRISLPANGSTWRVQAGQEPGNPGNPHPSATVEACGQNTQGNISIGFVSQFGENDGNPYVSTDCQISQGSYDPNDKQGWPLGYGPERLITPGQPLDYLIRFQNTGNDTAFSVVIVDTLSKWLDAASVRPGASSHPCQFTLSGQGILRFHFQDILLPDSNANETASHGFVKFRVQQRDSVPLGTRITNQAAIYFDLNAPVITNQTEHRVGVKFVTSSTGNVIGAAQTLYVWPNPAAPGSTLYLTSLSLTKGRFDLFDAQGRFVSTQPVSGDRVYLPAGQLPSGMYWFKVFDQGNMKGVGKLVVQ